MIWSCMYTSQAQRYGTNQRWVQPAATAASLGDRKSCESNMMLLHKDTLLLLSHNACTRAEQQEPHGPCELSKAHRHPED